MQISRVAVLALLLSVVSPGQVLEIFGDPKKACGLLEPEGLPRSEWKLSGRAFQCSTVPGQPMPAGGLEYVASGDYPDRVSRLKLIVSLMDDSDNGPLMELHERLAAAMLERIGLKLSEELREAIRSERPFRRAERGANVTFDPGRQLSTVLVLIVRDPRIRAVPIPRVKR